MICNECETVAHCTNHGCIPKQPAQKRPQNCGTSYCSCIECVMEPAQRTWVGLTNQERGNVIDNSLTPACVVLATEAKLKEKNT